MSHQASYVRILLQPLAIALLCALALRFFVSAYTIPSSSMTPTLQVGDHVLVTRHLTRAPRPGDVVVFRRSADTGPFFVKRIIAGPGDHVEIQGRVMLNGHTLAEPYLSSTVQSGLFLPDIVPAGHYFVMGDQREDSIDSRSWGYLREDAIVGRARLVFWSAGDGTSPASANAATTNPSRIRRYPVRWSRFFEPVR